ncbi:MAG: MFS transporter [Spirochaetia bacterium]
MPYISFASNFLWVMVIGLLGPSVPGIVDDLGITYPQAGLFFTLLSLGSLFGTTVGGIATDYANRKLLYAGFSGFLGLGLIAMGFAPTYIVICIIIFAFSLFGSPIGAVGQSIMLDMFPHNRAKYLSIQTFFAALGSFTAPLLVALNFTVGLSWRWPFVQTAVICFLLIPAIVFARIPDASTERSGHRPIKEILKNPNIILAAVLIFLSVSLDLGFSYWLAEYFKSELEVSMRLSSAIVGIYLAGVLTGRLSTSWIIRRIKSKNLLFIGLLTGFISLIIFIVVPSIPVKVIFCLIYGLGIAPVFPLVMAKGAEEYPKQPGAVTGVLFACLSLGGMLFPLLLGVLASSYGIERSYLFNLFVIAAVAAGLFIWIRRRNIPSDQSTMR